MNGDQVTMKDGQVVIVRNGQTTPMREEMTVADGTKVMPNGQLILGDGTARMLREGETLPLERPSTNPENMSNRGFTEAMEDAETKDEQHDQG